MALATAPEYSYQDTLAQGTEVDWLADNHETTLSTFIDRKNLYGSFFSDAEVRREILWSGPINVIADFRQFIQIILITRVAHLLIDLYPLATRWKHLISCLSGLYLIDSFISRVSDTNSEYKSFMRKFALSVILYYVLVYYIVGKSISYTRSRSNKYRRSIYLAGLIVVIMPIMVNEVLIYYQDKLYLTALRSIFMTISMKVFSQLQDYGDDGAPLESLPAISGYFLHPASCLFGPWHKRSITAGSGRTRRSQVIGEFARQSKKAAYIFGPTLLLLLMSASLLDLADVIISFELSSTLSHQASVFLEAQKFRFSHYFLSYLSWAPLSLWQEADSSASEIQLCRIAKIEWPRSLVEVVAFWNIPMSNWLRERVFTPLRTVKPSSGGNPYAVMVTFATSALLHGFKFNIWSVLLQLGLLSLLEHWLRKKLASKLDACVLARSCSLSSSSSSAGQGCGLHRWTELNSPMVRAVNLAFRLLALAHLTYLGYIFRGDTDRNSFADDIAAWSELHFYSPLLATLMFIIAKITL